MGRGRNSGRNFRRKTQAIAAKHGFVVNDSVGCGGQTFFVKDEEGSGDVRRDRETTTQGLARVYNTMGLRKNHAQHLVNAMCSHKKEKENLTRAISYDNFLELMIYGIKTTQTKEETKNLIDMWENFPKYQDPDTIVKVLICATTYGVQDFVHHLHDHYDIIFA